VSSVVAAVRIYTRQALLHVRAPLATAELIERQIVGDTVQPKPDRAACFIERMSMLPCAEEDLLQDLIRHVSIAGDPHDKCEDDPGMAIVQHPQRLGFTSNERGDQRLVWHIVVR
jgi:hypothetical protein